MDKDIQGQDEVDLLPLPDTFVPAGAVPFFTTRRGGLSSGCYESLNLGHHVGDESHLVTQNRERVQRRLHPFAQTLCLIEQVHGTKAIVASPEKPLQKADALVTKTPGVAIAVMTADCAPVVFYDPVEHVAGVAHAGWRGALNGICESAIDLMESLGADARQMLAIIGPTIRPPNYEVDSVFFDTFRNHNFHKPENNVEKFFLSLEMNGRFQFNLPNYIGERLRLRGIPQEGLKDVGLCTLQKKDLFFSYRRSSGQGEKNCGRQIGGIVLV